MKIRFFLAMIFCSILAQSAHAIQSSQELAVDRRVHTYVYNPNEVFVFKGHYRFQSSIELEAGETIQSISVGDSTTWQILPQGNRIFLKPIDQDATTNMTVVTSRRVYLFELHADEAVDIRDDEMVFVARFVYPEGDEFTDVQFFDNNIANEEEDLIPPPSKDFNYNYSITGSHLIAPEKIFDDGEFTYMEFKGVNAALPAIFQVNKYGRESLVNYRVSGPYIVVERVGQQFTLRKGEEITCVFNDASPLKREEEEGKWFGVF